jgi:hypothetical protein
VTADAEAATKVNPLRLADKVVGYIELGVVDSTFAASVIL